MSDVGPASHPPLHDLHHCDILTTAHTTPKKGPRLTRWRRIQTRNRDSATQGKDPRHQRPSLNHLTLTKRYLWPTSKSSPHRLIAWSSPRHMVLDPLLRLQVSPTLCAYALTPPCRSRPCARYILRTLNLGRPGLSRKCNLALETAERGAAPDVKVPRGGSRREGQEKVAAVANGGLDLMAAG
jgi:hypothetical protein